MSNSRPPQPETTQQQQSAQSPSAQARSRAFLADETRFQGRYGSSLKDTLYQAYRPALALTFLCLLIGLVGRAALLGNANLIGYWVDSLCKRPTGCPSLPSGLEGFQSSDFLLLLVAANIVGFVFTLAFRTGLSRLSADAVSRIYDETTLRTSRLPMSFFDQNPSGRVMTRFTSDYNSIFRIFGGPIAEFLSIIFDLLAMTVLITLASPWLLPFWLLAGLANYGVYRWFLPRLRTARRELALRRSPAIAHFAETATGATTIRAFQREGMFSERFSRLNDHFLEQKKRTVTLFARFSFSMGVATALSFLLTGFACWWLVERGSIGLGAVGVAFAYLGLSSHILLNFFDWLGQFEEAMTGMERMNEYLRLPLEPAAKLPSSALFETGHPKEMAKEKARETAKKTASENPKERIPREPPGDTPGEITGEFPGENSAPPSSHRVLAKAGVPVSVQDLWFRYRPNLPHVLQGVNLEIRAGERLAVVGKTGSGKTSLVQALFHLYPIEKGAIEVDGLAVQLEEDGKKNSIGLSSYRSLLAYITQEPTLFLGTLRENILAPGARPGKAPGKTTSSETTSGKTTSKAEAPPRAAALPSHTEEEIIEALRRVQFLREDATDEEYRYWLDYQVEEKGRNLSSGERQLICMARCLLQDAPVVILDEATSSVDPRSEEILTRATEEFFQGKTQIVIAHRLSTVRSCDRVLWLSEGKVHRLGPPAEVLPEFERSNLHI